MKLRLPLIVLLVSFLQNIHAQALTQFVKDGYVIAGAGCSQGFSKSYTFKPKDASSYEHLGGDFGKDKYQVYYKGQVLPQLNAAKAKAIYAKNKGGEDDVYRRSEPFITDGIQLYYNNVLMENADVKKGATQIVATPPWPG